jgi:hypothetical protein
MTILEPILKLKRDMRAAAATLGQEEARYLVDLYYQRQHDRITAANRTRAAADAGEPHAVLQFFTDQSDVLERQIKSALEPYAKAHPAGSWMMAQKGVGPVIAAGFLSRLELKPTVGHWWRFCGLDPTVTWGKGETRPWNAALKRLCWITGECFVKVSGYDDAFYGKVYADRKAWETQQNEAGAYADQAKASLSAKRFGEDTQARKHYEAGRLPPARIHLRAERCAVKLFLSHLHEVWHRAETGEAPPKPFAIAQGGHAHYIAPPPG